MAFVYKSKDRTHDLFDEEEFDTPGPSHYKIDKEKSFKKNMYSFNSATKRFKNNMEIINRPGPGYYVNDLKKISMFQPPIVNEGIQCFGITSKRFDSAHQNSELINLGPGTYDTKDQFKVNFKKIDIKRPKTYAPKSLKNNDLLNENDVNLEKQKKVIEKKSSYLFIEDYPGPGEYNMRKDFFKKSYNSGEKYNFGSNKTRFNSKSKKKFKEKVLNDFDFVLENLNNQKMNRTNYFNLKVNKEQTKSEIEKIENILIYKKFKKLFNTAKKNLNSPEINVNKTNINKPKTAHNHTRLHNLLNKDVLSYPSVGEYNVDFGVNSKVKEIEMKLDMGLKKCPFKMGSNRFKYDKDKESVVGPGKYIKDKKINHKNIGNFGTNQTRFNSMMKNEQDFINKTSYFDWNKKSFNINFI